MCGVTVREVPIESVILALYLLPGREREKRTTLLTDSIDVPDVCKRGGEGECDGAAEQGVGTDCCRDGGEVLGEGWTRAVRSAIARTILCPSHSSNLPLTCLMCGIHTCGYMLPWEVGKGRGRRSPWLPRRA